MPALLTRMSSGAPPSPACRPANNWSRSPSRPSSQPMTNACPPAGGHGLLGGRVVAGVVPRDQGAAGAQPLGNGPADAPRGAGHQRRLTGQIPHVDLLVRPRYPVVAETCTAPRRAATAGGQ